MDHPAKGIQFIGPLSTQNGVVADAMAHLKSLATNATFRDKWMPPEAWAKALDVNFGVEYSKRNVSRALNGLECNQSFPNPMDAEETIVVQQHHFNVNKQSKCKFFLFRLSTTNQENFLVAAKSKDLWQKAYDNAMELVRPSERHERMTRKRQCHQQAQDFENELSNLARQNIQKIRKTLPSEWSPPPSPEEAKQMLIAAWYSKYASTAGPPPFDLLQAALQQENTVS